MVQNSIQWNLSEDKCFEIINLTLIDILKKTSSKKIYFVMVIDNIKKNFNSFIKFLPEFELVNKMNFKLSTPELIIDQRIKTFPRIRLNSEFNKIKYRNNFLRGNLKN